MKIDEQEVNLDIKLEQVQNALEKLEAKTDQLSRDAQRDRDRYERMLDRIEDTSGAEKDRLKRDAYKVKQRMKQKFQLLKQLLARHQVLTDVEMKLIDLGTRRQLEEELEPVSLDLDSIRDVEAELEDTEQRRKARLEEAATSVGREVDGPVYDEIDEDLGERELIELEEGFGNIEEEVFDTEEAELELE